MLFDRQRRKDQLGGNLFVAEPLRQEVRTSISRLVNSSAGVGCRCAGSGGRRPLAGGGEAAAVASKRRQQFLEISQRTWTGDVRGLELLEQRDQVRAAVDQEAQRAAGRGEGDGFLQGGAARRLRRPVRQTPAPADRRSRSAGGANCAPARRPGSRRAAPLPAPALAHRNRGGRQEGAHLGEIGLFPEIAAAQRACRSHGARQGPLSDPVASATRCSSDWTAPARADMPRSSRCSPRASTCGLRVCRAAAGQGDQDKAGVAVDHRPAMGGPGHGGEAHEVFLGPIQLVFLIVEPAQAEE